MRHVHTLSGEQIVDSYDVQGLSVRAIAKKCGCSYSGMHYHMTTKLGLVLNDQHTHHLSNEQIKDGYARGLSTHKLGALCGCSRQTINNRLVALGVTLRSNNDPGRRTKLKLKLADGQLAERYNRGTSANALAQMNGVSTKTMLRYLRDTLQLTMRTRVDAIRLTHTHTHTQ